MRFWTRGSGARDAAAAVGAAIRRQTLLAAGGALALLLVLGALLAPALAPADPLGMNPAARFAAPGAGHLLGTDQFGRDLLSRILYGARISLGVGVASVALSVAAGLLLGSLAAMREGRIETAVMRSMDVLFAFPAIILALALIAVRGAGLGNVILAVAIVNLPVFVRTVRAAVMATKPVEFVVASTALGRSDAATFARHILPNALAPILVQATLSMSTAILAEAALSFLGVGAQPPTPSWGGMLADSRAFMEVAPWTAIFPGAAIMLGVLCFNMLGDGVRDALDPRLRNV